MSHFLYLNISNNNPVPAPTVASATRLPTKLATFDSFVTLEGHGTTPKSDLQRSLDHHTNCRRFLHANLKSVKSQHAAQSQAIIVTKSMIFRQMEFWPRTKDNSQDLPRSSTGSLSSDDFHLHVSLQCKFEELFNLKLDFFSGGC